MLRRWFLCCVVMATTGCKTLHEADAAMSAWTRERLAPEAERGEEPEEEPQAPKQGVEAASEPAEKKTAEPAGKPTHALEPVHESDAARSAAAEALFESGHEAMSRKDYDTACARFEESNRLEPAVGALLNLAACEEQRGRLATSWQLFKRVMSELPAGDDRYPIAQRRASSLRPRVPHLTLELESGAPQQTTVTYGKVVLGRASFNVPLPFDPGEHRFEVAAPKRESRSYSVALSEGDKKTLSVGPGDPK